MPLRRPLLLLSLLLMAHGAMAGLASGETLAGRLSGGDDPVDGRPRIAERADEGPALPAARVLDPTPPALAPPTSAGSAAPVGVQDGSPGGGTPPPAATPPPPPNSPPAPASAPASAPPAPDDRAGLPLGDTARKIEPMLRRRLANALVERAVGFTSERAAETTEFDLALELALRAAELDPGDVDRWRLLLQIADIVERHEVEQRAIERIVALDPTDEVARLRRLTGRVDEEDTAEERIATLRALLAPESVAALGEAVASRLAFDLAALLRRSGDLDGYATWLAEAVALDPSNPLAASELAGFFAATTDDPGALAELLVARCLADPTNLLALEQLADFALGHGAFVGARRSLGLLSELYGGPLAVLPDLLTKLVLAQWGSGEPDKALALIELRQRDENDAVRRRMEGMRRAFEQGATTDTLQSMVAGLSALASLRLREFSAAGEFTSERISAFQTPIWPELVAARAAMLQVLGRPDEAAATRELVEVQRLVAASSRDSASLTPEQRALDMAESAWWILFLGDDVAAGRAVVDDAMASAVLPEPVVARLNAWLALREDRPDDAGPLFEACAESDARCRLGLAIIALDRGDRRAAAAALLDVARRQGGTVEGLWAYETLVKLLGGRAPMKGAVGDIEAQIATLPAAFDRLLLDPSRALVMTIRAADPESAAGGEAGAVAGPLERIDLLVTIENRSELPLALEPGGPLRPTLSLPLSATTFGLNRASGPLPLPAMADIGRRLRIGPKSSMEARINLSRCPVEPSIALSRLVRERTLAGTTVSLNGQGILNAVSPQDAGVENRLRPGILGVESAPLNVRIEGIPFETGWRTAAMEAVKVVDREKDLDALAAMAFRAGLATDARLAALTAEQRSEIESAVGEQARSVAEALSQIGPTGSAWIAMQLAPGRSSLAELESALRASTDPDVRLAVLLSLVEDTADPALEAARRGDDPALRRVAELIENRLLRAAAARQE